MPDSITRLNAALEGRYTIEGELGEGGMATVCVADDLKHNRKVALKVLKPDLAAVVGAERFLAEIETTLIFSWGPGDAGSTHRTPRSQRNERGSDTRRRRTVMKRIILGLTLSIALSYSAFPSAVHAQDAGSAWPSVTDFDERGPFAIQRETNVGPNAAYDIVRPTELGEGGRKHPIISWNNGTLYQIDRYQHLLDHWASHGFVVMGAHTNRTRGGAVHKAAIDWLVAENGRAGSAYIGMLDLTKIGAAGHSQGGGATITAGANVPGPAGIVTTMPLMPISAFERPHLAQHTASMLLVSATEDERANRVADQALADVTTEFVDAQFVGVHGDAMNPGIQGATVAWFRYQLMGDAKAKAHFYPPETCGLCRDGAWMRLRRNNSPP